MQSAIPRRRVPFAVPASVQVRRSYAESRYGQLHLHTVYPAGGGFDERRPLLCLHPLGASSKYFVPLLTELARDRIVYALDVPGFGHSDAPDRQWSLMEVAEVLSEFADTLRLRSFDVYGVQLGALLAIEMATLRSVQVHGVVLDSVPHYTHQEAKLQQWSHLPILPEVDGSHLIKEWQRLVGARAKQIDSDHMTRALVDVLQARQYNGLAQQALLDYPTAQRLAEVRQPGLIVCSHPEFQEHCRRAKQAYSLAVYEEPSDVSAHMLAYPPLRVLHSVRQFLNR